MYKNIVKPTLKLPMFMSVEEIDRHCPRNIDRYTAVEDYTDWLNAPFDEGCLVRFLHKMSAHLRRYYPWEEILYTSLYVIISVLAFIGNGVVILAVIRKREMRTNRNVLIVNLALSNLVLALTTIPFLWLPSIDFEFPYSNVFCKFANALPGSNIYCSTLTISVMAIDRYYSVKQMSTAHPGQGQCFKAIVVSFLIWLASFILSVPLLIYYDVTMLYVFKDVRVSRLTADGRNETAIESYGWRMCRLGGGGETDETGGLNLNTQTIQSIVSILQVLMLYVVPLVVLSIFNVKLTRFLKMNAKQMDKNRNPSTKRRSSEFPSNSRMSVTAFNMPTVKLPAGYERASNRRQNRTTALLVAMAGAYAVLWFPFTLVSVLIDLDILYMEKGKGAALIERIDQTCKLISILSICVNPFLYGFLNTNFRNEFTEIFTTIVNAFPVSLRRFFAKKERKIISGRAGAYSVIDPSTRVESEVRTLMTTSVTTNNINNSSRSK